eukprot:5412823-Pleurochrysis_carterae.AAC.1
MARHDRKCTITLFMFIAGSVDSLATNLQAQPAYTHMTGNLLVRRVLIYDVRQYVNMRGTIVDEPCPTVARLAVYMWET